MFDPFDHFASIRSNRTARSDSSAALDAASDMRGLEDQLDKLTLVCMAMWSLMQDKMRVTEEELLQRVRTLDVMDGVTDGKATRGVAKCPKCERTMSPRHKRCLYCGYGQLVQSAFDTLG